MEKEACFTGLTATVNARMISYPCSVKFIIPLTPVWSKHLFCRFISMDQQWNRDCSEAIHPAPLPIRYLAMSDGGGPSILVFLDLSLDFNISQLQYSLGTGSGEHYLIMGCFFSLGLISVSVGWMGRDLFLGPSSVGPLCAIKLLFSPNDHVDTSLLEDFTRSPFNIYTIWDFWVRSSTALGFDLITAGSARGMTGLLFEVRKAP